MRYEPTEYVSLEHLAAVLRLPRRYLRDLATAGRIPVLRPGGRMRFRVDDVRDSLRGLAERIAATEPSRPKESVDE
ncbi:MAG TPA: helix-turn-helix domain-containing protein [Sedimentisphaerales bacterium]|nr:helix-turn-helix domain-containing protein [Sedimentisphaerales bacterium]